MGILICGLILFFAVHSVSIVNEAWRDAMVARLGAPAWRGLYSLVSLAGFALLVWGYGIARQEPIVLYRPPAWTHPVAMVLMVTVFPLLLAAYLPGRIQRATRHPMLAATKIWAFAHLLANGALADVLLFGSFLVWAIADRVSMKHRSPRRPPGAKERAINDIFAVAAGLGIYVAFLFWWHAALFGVALR